MGTVPGGGSFAPGQGSNLCCTKVSDVVSLEWYLSALYKLVAVQPAKVLVLECMFIHAVEHVYMCAHCHV